MKTKWNIAFLLLTMAVAAGCSDTDDIVADPVAQSMDKRLQVAFQVTRPLMELPSASRAITDDSAINDYTVWVFNNGTFVEEVKKGGTYIGSDGKSYAKVSYDPNGGTMYLMLRESYTSVRLMMIANATVTVTKPAVGTTFEEAKQNIGTFNMSTDYMYMPFYGETSESEAFAVKTGAKGTIYLLRAMAKVEVDASDAADHFTLTGMSVYRVNDTGTIVQQATITNNPSMTESAEGTVQDGNRAYIYLPEIADVNETSNKTFVIIQGEYKDTEGTVTTKYYRMDFIKRITTEGQGVSYDDVEQIERNHRYIFDIQYLTESAGHGTLAEAVSGEADNKIVAKSMELIVIDDKDIRDITTNSLIYLGVTSANIEAKLNAEQTYYIARIRVVTNNSDGWQIEALPKGVTVTRDTWKPGESTDNQSGVQSVWVFLDKDTYTSGQSVDLYIYSGNIRKKITITIPTNTNPSEGEGVGQ